MSVLDKIAYFQGKRDESLNIVLARELAESEDIYGIEEISENVFSHDKNIQSDCLKVLYEIGYIKPELIAKYIDVFIKLLRSKNNRMVWGAMIALSIIAPIKEKEIFANLDNIYSCIEKGSVITVDNGIKVLAIIASKDKEYNKVIFPYLIKHLKVCRLKEVAQHSESIFPAVNDENKEEFIMILKERENMLTKPQLARVKKLYKAIDKKFK